MMVTLWLLSSLGWCCHVLLLTTTTDGFAPPPVRPVRQKSTWSSGGTTTTTTTTTTDLRSFSSSDDNDNDNNADDNDASVDVVRRRLVLSSLLTTAASVLPVSSDAATSILSPTTSDSIATTTTTTTNIHVPPLDDRAHSYYVMENGMRVVLCSDPSSNTAAAAVDVHVGATADPDDVPGLAHFNEHMLFLGTEKYPKEDSFSTFLSSHGGFSNAFTDTEDTVYYFDVDAESTSVLSEGLDRFGSFFREALFTESATGRELNAIESENVKNLQSDTFRLYQMEKSRANPNHPYSKFFTGNRKTLLEDTLAKGLDLRRELFRFYRAHYSSERMTLAVVAPQDLRTLRAAVDRAFSGVPRRGVEAPETAWNGAEVPFFGPTPGVVEGARVAVEVVPVTDARRVEITFPVIYDERLDREFSRTHKPDFYAAHLLGHEGPGSLLSFLKRKGWANGVGASGGGTRLSDFETFEVEVELTEKGLAAVDDVVEAVFSYVTMMRRESIPDRVFDEVLLLSELEWRFATPGDKTNYAQSLAENLKFYEPEYVVAGPRRLAVDDLRSSDADPSDPRAIFRDDASRAAADDATKRYVDRLTVDRALVTVISKSFAGRTDRKEKWYGTDYRVRRVKPETLARWNDPFRARDAGMDFPAPNRFLPRENGLRVKRPVKKRRSDEPPTFEERMTPVAPPVVVRDDERWTVRFKQDDRFGEPKAFLVLELITDAAFNTPRRALLALFYRTCVAEGLDEYAYDAGLAGLTYDVQILPRGVRLTFGGYDDRLADFAVDVTNRLVRAADPSSPLVPTDRRGFERYKDQIARGLAAFDVRQPYSRAVFYGSLLTTPGRFQYDNAALRAALDDVDVDDLRDYARTLFAAGKGEALVQGNLERAEATRLVDAVDRALDFRAVADEPARLKALPLPMGRTKLAVAEPNASNRNSASTVYLQSLDRSDRAHVLMELVNAVINQPYYEDLRTERQLGYVVSSGIKGVEDTRALALVVQSSVATAERLTEITEGFVRDFRTNTLDRLNEGDFATYVKSLVERKTEPDRKLAQEVTRNWSEISSGRYRFDRAQREAAALLTLTKRDLCDFWDDLARTRSLAIEVVPRAGAASSATPPERAKSDDDAVRLGIKDVETFRRARATVGESMSSSSTTSTTA